jgi:hypothetical protein
VTWQVKDISIKFLNKVRDKAKEYENFHLALDESNDTGDTAQLLTIIWVITEPKVVEELASLESLHGTTTEKESFECVWNHEGTWTALDITKWCDNRQGS